MQPVRFVPSPGQEIKTVFDCPYGTGVIETKTSPLLFTPRVQLDPTSTYNFKVWIKVNDDGSTFTTYKDVKDSTASMITAPKSFGCPLTLQIMREPVVDKEGNSFEKSAIQDWLEKHGSSPITRTPMTAKDLIPNRALQEAIQESVLTKEVTFSPIIDKGFIYVGFAEYDNEEKLVKKGEGARRCDGTYYYYPVSHIAIPSDGKFQMFHVKIGPNTARQHHPDAKFISGLVIVNYRHPLPVGNAIYQISDTKLYEDI